MPGVHPEGRGTSLSLVSLSGHGGEATRGGPFPPAQALLGTLLSSPKGDGTMSDGVRDGQRRSEQLRLEDARRRGDEAEMRRDGSQAAMDRARNERLHAERHRADEARRRRLR